MKTIPAKIRICAALIAAFLFHAQTSQAAVAFTVTPSSVSNTYAGTITLQVTGLTSGDTVVVQKFLDVNTNGIVDVNDYLVQQFQMTDGQAGMVIGGITNFNVPGDTDTTAGQITAKLNFRGGDFMQNIVGKYFYKLSGHFTPPITNSFIVTNFLFAQTITGNVVSNETSTTLSNAVVILFPAPRAGGDHGPGTPVAGTVASKTGSYTIQLPPGAYVPLAFRSNYVANYSTSPVLTLTNNETITTNLTVTNATAAITGKYVDSNNSTIGLPGVLVPVSTTNGMIGSGFTDTNGNFVARVTTGTWSIGGDADGLIVHGYVGYDDNPTNVTSGTLNVTVPFTKATALFYGNVSDGSGNPLTGINVEAFDTNDFYDASGITGTNGNYVIGIIGNLANGDLWQSQVSNGSDKNNPTNYIFSQTWSDENGGTNVTTGEAVLQNITDLLATNFISGNVQFNDTNVIGVGVTANANINGADYSLYMDTDANGNYSFNVANGDWDVSVNCNGGDNDSLDNILGNGNYQCPGDQSTNINNNNVTANFTIISCNGVQINTTSLPSGQVGSYYDVQLEASSCSGSYTWSLNNDPQDFPSALTLDSSGIIYGTPDTAGTNNFSVHVDDGNGHTADQPLTLIIVANTNTNPPPLNIATTGNQLVVFYPQSGSNYVLQTTTNLTTGPWMTATGGVSVIAFTFSNTAPTMFFRLH